MPASECLSIPPNEGGGREAAGTTSALMSAYTAMVKVFGCRPSQVWRQGMGPAYGNRPCTNPRGCGDGLWGFEVLLCCGDGETGSALASAGTC